MHLNISNYFVKHSIGMVYDLIYVHLCLNLYNKKKPGTNEQLYSLKLGVQLHFIHYCSCFNLVSKWRLNLWQK